ncbi:PREDICTED: polycystic kidney disease 1 like 1-like [Priapulus caudatus]|uniref:Polycystic kidney disease 1 like 1-like n=1 Tax=Priapulus caudatus TaxID=37621 RepID=A0ABM1EL68_PRICU|nr:PREDICTED: polycystic kidney disease 1 like 1-like [Priapulus caudatus]
MLYATQQKIELTAVSETDAPRWYAWHMGDARRDNVNTVSPTRHYAYDLPGRYVVQVLAVNHISNASSQPVELVLQTAVSELSIVHAGSALRGNATTLRVRFTGSDLTLEWNFGDGHAATVTQQNTSVNHTFDRIGEYEVSVKAYNDISTAKATLTLFVVERPCKTPAISFGLLGTDSSHHTFERATSVVIEPVVTIECSMTEVANFQWSLYHRLNSSQLSPPGLDKATLQQRVLYLDKNLLHYGDYRAMLKVKMNGTFVYTMTEVNFSVVASPLQSVIGGGRQRNVSRQDVLELNASASHDPDFPRDASFSYRWTCQPLHTPTAPCFRDGHELPRNATDPVLRLPAATFASEHSSFLVKVTAEKPGRRSRVASQLLQLNDDAAAAGTLAILVDCKACENGYVNDDDVPAFSAICPRCDESNVDYLWSVYVVADGHQTGTQYLL